jgi:allantoicase
VRKVIVDTAHLRGNYPDRFSLEGCLQPEALVPADDTQWTPIMGNQRLCPDREHTFRPRGHLPTRSSAFRTCA